LAAVPRQETAVVVTADHGESLGEHDVFYNHVGLYETNLRIPLLIHVPGQPAGRHAFDVSTLDLAPTVAELFGLGLDNEMRGRSLVSAVAGRPDAALLEGGPFVAEHAHRQALSLQEGDWKLIWQREPAPPLPVGESLYHLGRDPEERRDLASDHPERVTAMKRALEAAAGEGDGPAPSRPIDAAEREQLRALGYVEP
ncbi:MAG: sulfatase family protein, partial [Myxococcota bacterium]